MLAIDKNIEKHKSMLYEISNRTDSDWVLQGTERDKNPVKMNTAKTHALPLRSRVFLGKGKGYAETQFVSGAPTIFVNDVYIDKQGGIHSIGEEKQDGWDLHKGLKSLGYDLNVEYKRALSLQISFESGVLDLNKYGQDPTLHSFVAHHENNNKAPNADEAPSGNKSKMFNFDPIQKSVKSEVKLTASLDVTYEALTLVYNLRKQLASGSYDYNTAKIDALINLFGLNTGAQDLETTPQKVEVLVAMAQGNPKQFLDTIKETYDQYKMIVLTAQELKVINFVKKEVTFHKDKTSRIMFNTEATKLKDQIEEFSTFLLDPKNEKDYAALTIAVEEAKKKSL